MKKLKRTKHPEEEEHAPPNACRPPADFPTLPEWGVRGVAPRPPAQRHGRAAAVTACPPYQATTALVPTASAAAAPQRADGLRRRRCFCTAEGSDAKAWLARPFSPLVSSSSSLWRSASPHLWPVGRTDGGGRPLCLQTRSCNDVSHVAKNWFRCQVSLAYISLSPRFCQTRTLADAFSRKRPSVGHCLRKLRSNKRRARRPTLARPHLCESS